MATESFQALKTFFETAEVARKATKPLHDTAEVALQLDGGPAHFTVKEGRATVLEGPAQKPDFTLTLPDGAVKRITSLQSDDVGEFGIEFFKLVLEHDPAAKVRVKIDAPTGTLLSHGYLGVLAQGGMKVTWWLLKNGVKNPKAAIDRLRGGGKPVA
jgi:SCP-2 sterol transfer family protein